MTISLPISRTSAAESGPTVWQAQRRVNAAMGGPGAPGASAASPPKARKSDGHVLEPDEEREHEAGDAVRSCERTGIDRGMSAMESCSCCAWQMALVVQDTWLTGGAVAGAR